MQLGHSSGLADRLYWRLLLVLLQLQLMLVLLLLLLLGGEKRSKPVELLSYPRWTHVMLVCQGRCRCLMLLLLRDPKSACCLFWRQIGWLCKWLVFMMLSLAHDGGSSNCKRGCLLARLLAPRL